MYLYTFAVYINGEPLYYVVLHFHQKCYVNGCEHYAIVNSIIIIYNYVYRVYHENIPISCRGEFAALIKTGICRFTYKLKKKIKFV